MRMVKSQWLNFNLLGRTLLFLNLSYLKAMSCPCGAKKIKSCEVNFIRKVRNSGFLF